MTSSEEDYNTLIGAFRGSGGYKPSVSNYSGDSTQPVPHPKGDAARFAR